MRRGLHIREWRVVLRLSITNLSFHVHHGRSAQPLQDSRGLPVAEPFVPDNGPIGSGAAARAPANNWA